MLCKGCSEFFTSPQYPPKRGERHTYGAFPSRPWEILEDCEQDGRRFDDGHACKFCALFIASLGPDRMKTLTGMTSKVTRRRVNSRIKCRYSWHFLTDSAAKDVIEINIEVSLQKDSLLTTVILIDSRNDKCPGEPPAGSLSRQNWNENILRMIPQWLKDCDRRHVGCQKVRSRSQQDQTWNPGRLLQLTTNSISSEDTIRLCDMITVPEKVSYAALSHCWGPNPTFLTLTESNRSMLMSGLPVNDFPRTFQHTFHVAKALDLKYVWIDALCILQDSPEDWLKEAASMSKVYSYSHLNICALWASNPDEGLFHHRHDCLVDCYVDVSWPGLEGRFSCQDRHISFRGPEPLRSRAWVFQEEALSSRSLYFATDHVYFQCGEKQFSESTPHGEIVLNGVDPRNIKTVLAPVRHQGENADSLELWDSILSRYTTRKLTVESDRLAALSGVARVLRDQYPDTVYLAGLWLHSLPSSLLWSPRTHDPEASGVRDDFASYVAPSWSWASFRGEVVPYGDTHLLHRYAQVLEASTTPLLDELGPVKAGFIRLKGPLCRGRIRHDPERTPLGDLRLELNGRKMSRDVPYFDRQAISDLRCPGTEVFCLPIEGAQAQHDATDLRPMYIYGLLLEPTANIRGQYRRIGYFICECSTSWWPDLRDIRYRLARHLTWQLFHEYYHKNDYKIMQKAFETSKLEERYYEEVDGNNEYTITII